MADGERPILGLNAMKTAASNLQSADELAKRILKLRHADEDYRIVAEHKRELRDLRSVDPGRRWPSFDVSVTRPNAILSYVGAVVRHRGHNNGSIDVVTGQVSSMLAALKQHQGGHMLEYSWRRSLGSAAGQPPGTEERITISKLPERTSVLVNEASIAIPVVQSMYVRRPDILDRDEPNPDVVERLYGPKPTRFIFPDFLEDTIIGPIDRDREADTVLFIGNEAINGFLEWNAVSASPLTASLPPASRRTLA